MSAYAVGMDIGVGSAILWDGHPGMVIEGPDEDGQFLVEFAQSGGGLDTAWFLPGDSRVVPAPRG